MVIHCERIMKRRCQDQRVVQTVHRFFCESEFARVLMVRVCVDRGDGKSRFTHRWLILLQFLSQPLWQCVARLLSPVSSFSEKKSRKTKSATQRPVVLDAYSQIDLIEALERQKGGRVRLALYGVNHKGRRLDWPSSLVIQPKEVEEL